MKKCGKCRGDATCVLTVHLALSQSVKQNLCGRCLNDTVKHLIASARHKGLDVEYLNAPHQ